MSALQARFSTMRRRRQVSRRAAAVLRTESRLVPPTDAAPSPEVVARPRRLLQLATPPATRGAVSPRLAGQVGAGVHEANALAEAVDAASDALAAPLAY